MERDKQEREHFLSIHSEDRDMVKYSNSNHFSIMLPDGLNNLKRAQLVDWSFPSNYYTFSKDYNNIHLALKITTANYPTFSNEIPKKERQLAYDIYTVLFRNKENEYTVTISEGFYNPVEMMHELTNQFNKAINERLKYYFDNPSEINDVLSVETEFTQNNFEQSKLQLERNEYDRFQIIFNNVKQKMLFGNSKDEFTIMCSSLFDKDYLNDKKYKEFNNWGLPSHLGFTMCDVTSVKMKPSMTHGYFSVEEGFWIEPSKTINLLGPSHFYLEIDELNNIDETSPFIFNNTMDNNLTNSRINSAFAKIPIVSAPPSQYYDKVAVNYKEFRPPKRSLTKLNIKCRYHNGALVNFGQVDFTIMIKFTTEN